MDAPAGEMAARIAALDWSATPLGAPGTWSPAVRLSVELALESRFPMILWFGPELVVFYNDAYAPILGAKHPGALGAPGLSPRAWGEPEVRAVIEPMLLRVLHDGEATWSDNQLLVLERRGFPEECYFTWSYSPIPEDGSVIGVFTAVFETTGSVVGARRLGLLAELTAATSDAPSAEEACRRATAALRGDPLDVPFHRLYLAGDDGRLRLVSGAGSVVEPGADFSDQRLTEALDAGEPLVAPSLLGWEVASPSWPEPVSQLALLRLTGSGEQRTTGLLVAGMSPRLPIDAAYVSFVELLASRVGAAVNDARAFEAERRRAEALAELDRSKSIFFSNVSHEFRTPLTLMLGPLDELLEDVRPPDWDVQRERLRSARNNGLRLLKLVNSLLEFSRIEAGAERPAVAVDVDSFTEDLVSVFRSAFEAAGLELELSLAGPGEPVLLDLDAWESIAFNLLSNALKYTPAGKVSVSLGVAGDHLELTVADTGVGIPPDELDQVFERFYRSSQRPGRSLEGTGIGLALTRELARVQGGDVWVTSAVGSGSTFVATVPLRLAGALEGGVTRHASAQARGFLEEAFRWLPDDAPPSPEAAQAPPAGRPARLLVVDDNADMRRYLQRVLSAHELELAADGAAALTSARRARPDLIVSDVMMPGVDGLELVRQLRSDPQLATVPVILLSARAGREATVEGLALGADDYLVKPFSASELNARVAALLRRGDRPPGGGGGGWPEPDGLVRDVVARLAGAEEFEAIAAGLQEAFAGHGPCLGTTLSMLEPGGDTVRQFFGGMLPGHISARYRLTPLSVDTFHTRMLLSGEPLLLPDAASLAASFPQFAAEFGRLGFESVVGLPFAAPDGSTAGSISTAWGEPLVLTAPVIAALETVAQVAGRAVERVRNAQWQREVARSLQQALLSSRSRETSAVVRTRYRSAQPSLEVGGDWFDVAPLPAGRLAVAVGDVVGRGLPAATAMGQLRAALTASVLQSADPSEAVAALDRFAAVVPDAACATVALAVLDPASSTLAYHCAGHPYPLLIGAGGGVELLDGGRSWPLQCGIEGDRGRSALAVFPPATGVLLFSDGLIERRGEHFDVGLERLVEIVRRHWNLPLGLLEATLLDELLGDVPARDDLAIVGMRRSGSAAGVYADAVHAAPAELREVRRRFSTWLRSIGAGEALIDDALLASGEALANAVEHGSDGDAAAVVSLEAALRPGELVIAVSDTGSWKAGAGAFDERGRGHRIMEALSNGVAVVSDRQGSVVTMRLPLAGPVGAARGVSG